MPVAARRCPPPCGRAVGLHPICPTCRVTGCAHEVTHYDGALRKICDACGTEISERKRKDGQNYRRYQEKGKGRQIQGTFSHALRGAPIGGFREKEPKPLRNFDGTLVKKDVERKPRVRKGGYRPITPQEAKKVERASDGAFCIPEGTDE